jgi:hypothetical protein
MLTALSPTAKRSIAASTLVCAARHFQWPHLEVVGDSALILRQLRDYRPPKNPRLLAPYSQARRLADHVRVRDQIGVRQCSHRVRVHNRMADALANLAMDCRASSQVLHPSARSGHCGLSAHLSADLCPWMADAVSPHGSLSVAFSGLNAVSEASRCIYCCNRLQLQHRCSTRNASAL